MTDTPVELALDGDPLDAIGGGAREGPAVARAGGIRLGRPPAMTPEQVRHARALLAEPDITVASIACLLGVSRSTTYKYVPELSPSHSVESGSSPRSALTS